MYCLRLDGLERDMRTSTEWSSRAYNRNTLLSTNELLDTIREAKQIPKFDFMSGYHILRIGKRSFRETVFKTRYRSYKFEILKLSLACAPGVFLSE